MRLFTSLLIAVSLLITPAVIASTPYLMTIRVIGEIAPGNTDRAIKDVEHAATLGRDVLLQIDSPGGYVSVGLQLKFWLDRLESSGRKIHTVIIRFAASMAALTFTEGTERTMEAGDRILFHEVSIEIGGYFLTGSELLELAEKGYLTRHANPRVLQELGTREGAAEFMKEFGAEVRAEGPEVQKSTDLLISIIAKNLGRDEGWVRTHLVRPGEDVTLSGVEAFKLGIATALDQGENDGAPTTGVYELSSQIRPYTLTLK